MQAVLADSYAICLKTQNYHWNVVSRHAFRSLHKLFEEQYLELVEGIDDIAEQIRQLGVLALASFGDYQAITQIKDGNSKLDADGMIKDLIADHGLIIERINATINVAYEGKDEATADLLIDRLRVHKKNKWMLESSL